jgi:hypothetical protein
MIRWILQTGSKKKSWATNQQETKPSKKRFSFEGGRIVRIENTLVFSWDVREADFGILEGRSRREQEDERKKTTSGGRPTTWGAVSRYPQSAAVVWLVFLREHRLRGRWGLKSRVYVYLRFRRGPTGYRRNFTREFHIEDEKMRERILRLCIHIHTICNTTYLGPKHAKLQASKSYRICETPHAYNHTTPTPCNTTHTCPTYLQPPYNTYNTTAPAPLQTPYNLHPYDITTTTTPYTLHAYTYMPTRCHRRADLLYENPIDCVDLSRASWRRKGYWIPMKTCNSGRLHIHNL